MTSSKFSAVDATLGYLYQVRCALLWSLRRFKSDPSFLVGVETLDDVAFETAGGDATSLLQTKHHRAGTGSLTDGSGDLWKTLRIWFEGHTSGEIPETAGLLLVTTGTAPGGSVAWRLRATDDRDVAAAQQGLDAVALSSTNADNAAAYAVYRATSSGERLALLERVIVLDASPNVRDLDADLRGEVRWACDRQHEEAFLERLEGWWLRRVLQQLVNLKGDRIGSAEIEACMADLRNQFLADSLPIDADLLDLAVDDATRSAHAEDTFVRQLSLVKVEKPRVVAAIRDFLRASEQRSRWLRKNLVQEVDLGRYERQLTEAWELQFETMREDLGSGSDEDECVRAAREVLLWAQRSAIPIRPRVTEPFLTRGSFHILADDVRIGWHPEFRDRLAAPPTPASGTR